MDLLAVEASSKAPVDTDVEALDERKKNRSVVFKEYLDLLREGTEVTG